MQQTKLESFIESIINIIVGYIIAVLSQLLIFPFFDVDVSFSDNLQIAAWFTAVSLVRSYVIRRWFNARLHAAAQAIAKKAT